MVDAFRTFPWFCDFFKFKGDLVKKILCIISAILCIFLTACGNDSSIGIIGGVDVPTSIIVAEKGEKAMYQQITPEEMLHDKDAQILVYCRSGRRSKIASESLAKLGYTNVKEFGGIIGWQYEVEK